MKNKNTTLPEQLGDECMS